MMYLRKRLKKYTRSCISGFLVGILLLGLGIPAYATEDTQAPVIDFDSITLSHTSITDPMVSPTISVKVTDESAIEMVAFSYTINGKLNAANVVLEYNAQTDRYEGEIQYDYYDPDEECCVGYYGDYILSSANAVDVYGNTANHSELNVPNGNFSVVGGGAMDITAPSIDCSDIQVTGTIEVEGRGIVSVPILDDSKLYHVYARFTHENSGSVIKQVTLKKSSNGRYEGELFFEEGESVPQGRYQLAHIYAVDAFFNEIYLYNTANNHFNDGENTIFNRVLEDLNHLDFVYGTDAGVVETDVKISSISVSNRFYNKGSTEKLTVVFDSKTEIERVNLMYYLNEMQQFMTGMEKTGTNTFSGTMPLFLYGNWHLCVLEVYDVHGNMIKLNDTRDLTFSDGIRTDLSDGDCYVGILDEETGICISDNFMDDTTQLTVNEQPLEGELYEEMLGEDCTGVALYDIEVTGTLGAVTSVAFEAPAGVEDGEEVVIVHHEDDGTNEEFEVIVEDGLVVIETDDFSPFLVKINGEWTPPAPSGGDETSSSTGSGSDSQGGDTSEEDGDASDSDVSDTESGDSTDGVTDEEDAKDPSKENGSEKDEVSDAGNTSDKQEKGKIKPIVIVIIVVAVLALGAGGYIFYRKKIQKNEPNI